MIAGPICNAMRLPSVELRDLRESRRLTELKGPHASEADKWGKGAAADDSVARFRDELLYPACCKPDEVI
jgi:hypothetical protein